MNLRAAIVLSILLSPSVAREADVMDAAARSVIKVRAYKGTKLLKDASGLVRDDFEYGTGFVVDENLVATAKHTVVYEDGSHARSVQCWSTAANRYEGCAVVYASPDRDVAVLWFPNAPKTRVSLRPDAAPPPRGTLLITGFPDVPYGRPRLMVTPGDLLEWNTESPGAGVLRERKNLAATDAFALPGCSGSPVFSAEQTVIGMVVSVVQDAEGEWNGTTYFVKAADLLPAVKAAHAAVAKKKGYEFLER